MLIGEIQQGITVLLHRIEQRLGMAGSVHIRAKTLKTLGIAAMVALNHRTTGHDNNSDTTEGECVERMGIRYVFEHP